MATKQPEEKPHMPSSSEEEEEEESGSSEEESGSSEEESESNHEDSKKDDDQVHQATQILEDESESDSDSEPTQKTTKSTQILEAESEDESESDSDTQKTTKSTLPEKRSLKQTEEPEGKKKMKKTSDEVEKKKKKITGDEAKQMFQRLFSEADEIALLQGILDFTSTGGDPSKDMDAFVDYVKNSISFKANKSQFKTKIQRLKKKFANTVRNSLKKGLSQDQIVFSRDVDQRVFDLSRKVWGDNGPNEVRSVPNTSSLLDISDLFKTENVSSFGLGESALSEGWGLVKDGPEKRAVEEKLRQLRGMQVKLCMQRSGVVAESAKLIFKDKASSSGM